MIPVGDDNSRNRRTPVATRLLLALNIAAFILLQQCGTDPNLPRSLGAVPQELIQGRDIQTPDQVIRSPMTGRTYRIPGLLETPIWVYLTVLTSMFLHGSLSHILGNMLYLGIFGDNVEDRMGSLRFLFFYIGMGVAAATAQVLASALSGEGLLTPMIGASGAISGVMGAYMVLFPRNRVYILTFGFYPMPVSAWFALGIWFLMQVLSASAAGPAGSGVAYAAHIGGFVAGWLWARIFEAGETRRRARFGGSGGITWRILD
ncbi:MAG: rhomboid family intramembrane serine protease [Treponema sp.]|nr:rhomboid family intramembrane serine protease [Treponema sp.]